MDFIYKAELSGETFLKGLSLEQNLILYGY